MKYLYINVTYVKKTNSLVLQTPPKKEIISRIQTKKSVTDAPENTVYTFRVQQS